jgi:OFA family oxalate/formate antiporter-like MFS transporter
MVVPPLVSLVTSSYGLFASYILLAVIICVACVPAVVVLGRSPMPSKNESSDGQNEVNHKKTGTSIQPRQWTSAEAARTMPFYLIMIVGFAIAAGYYFIAVHIVAYATDRGIDAISAAIVLTFMGAANVLGKVLISSVVAKIGSKITLMVLMSMQAVALFSLVGAQNLWSFFLLGALFGFGFGAASTIRMAMIVEIFGLRSIGSIIGVIEVAWALGAVTGPIMAGYVFDASGSYTIAFLSGGSFMVAGSVATFFINMPSHSS